MYGNGFQDLRFECPLEKVRNLDKDAKAKSSVLKLGRGHRFVLLGFRLLS